MAAVEIRDVAPGLWLWRQPHPSWREGNDWDPLVPSFVVESGGTTLVLDPLAPPPSAREAWDRIEAAAPEHTVVLKPDHVRDVDLFVRWYGLRAHGPFLFWRDDLPQTELEPVRAGDVLPGGLRALDDGRRMMETPLFLPEQQAIVVADALTAPDGVLRVWGSPWHETHVLPALRAWLDLPFEHVLIQHGEPVHGRDDLVAALEREPHGVLEA